MTARLARLLRTGLRPALWVLAAVGVLALLFPPGLAPPVPAPAGMSGGMIYGPVPGDAAGVRVAPGGGYFNGVWGDVHPVLVRLRAPGPAGHVGPFRSYGGGPWGVQLDVGLRLGPFADEPPATYMTVSLWPVALAACLLAWGVRRVRGGGDPGPPGLMVRLVRPWALTAAAVAGALAGPVFWAEASSVMIISTTDPADGVPGVTGWSGDGQSSGAAPAVRVAGRWTGTRFGRLTDWGGRTYSFLTVRLPALIALPLAVNAATLVRRRRAARRRAATMPA